MNQCMSYLKPSSHVRTFLRILDPEILMFWGLCLQFGKLHPGEYSLISNIYISAESQQKLVNIYGGKCLLQDSNLTLFGQYQPLKYTYHALLVNTDQIQANAFGQIYQQHIKSLC